MCKRPAASAPPQSPPKRVLREWPLFQATREAKRRQQHAGGRLGGTKRRKRDNDGPSSLARCNGSDSDSGSETGSGPGSGRPGSKRPGSETHGILESVLDHGATSETERESGWNPVREPETEGQNESENDNQREPKSNSDVPPCVPCAQGPAAPVRRRKNHHACDGRGGCPVGPGCNAVFTELYNLRRHKHQNSRTCGVCDNDFTQTTHFYKHFREAHPQLLDAQGGCAAHGVPVKRVSPQTLPEDPWKARLDAVDARHNLPRGTTWAAMTKGGGYARLVTTVRDSAKHDTIKRKFTAPQRAYAARLKTDPVRKHALAQQILEYVIERELLWSDATDDLGGVVGSGLKLRTHAGLWGLSLDRRDNGEPHFVVPADAWEPRLIEGYGGSTAAAASQAMVSAYRAMLPPAIGPGTNLRAVVAGMNTYKNPGDHWDGATCARLRAELARPVTSSMVHSAIAAEATCTNRGTINILYNSTMGAFQDPKAKEAFGTSAAMFLYTKELLMKQGARCAVSGILLRGLSGPIDERVFRMSVDAIDPLQGHVRGNLRLICQFLQAGANDKVKKTVDTDDGPSQWTPALFQEYIGVNAVDTMCNTSI